MGTTFSSPRLSIRNNGEVVRECNSLKDLAESLRYAIISRTVEESLYRNKEDVSIHSSEDDIIGEVKVKIRRGLSDE